MAWLVLIGHVESWKRKCLWLLICPRTDVPVTSTEQQWDMQWWEMQWWEMPGVQHRHPGRLTQCAQFQTGPSHGKVLIQRY